MWETIAPSFDTTRGTPWPRVESWLEEHVPSGDALVLDLMAGNGRHTAVATAHHATVALDWSRPLVRIGRDRVPEAHWLAADARRLPLPDASVDAALYVAGLHGIPDRSGRLASLRELCRVLRPGAPALVTVWSRHAPRFRALPGDGPADTVVPWRAGGHDEERRYHLYTAASLRDDLEAAHLETVHLDAVALGASDPDNLVATARRPAGPR